MQYSDGPVRQKPLSPRPKPAFPFQEVRRYTLEAIVTGMDYYRFVNATVLAIEAQKSQLRNGHTLWQTIPGGSVQCEDCASVDMLAVPEGTERFKVYAALPQSVVEGVLHLAAWHP